MGGAYKADAYENSLYLNPGENYNHWVNITLQGSVSNSIAVNSRIKVTFKENGIERSVYRDVNSGGSFGSNPLRQHIGLGKATSIEKVEIKWPVTGKVQIFDNIPVDANIIIKEGNNNFTTYQLNHFDYSSAKHPLIACSPGKN